MVGLDSFSIKIYSLKVKSTNNLEKLYIEILKGEIFSYLKIVVNLGTLESQK
jgi:hypothetical protein